MGINYRGRKAARINTLAIVYGFNVFTRQTNKIIKHTGNIKTSHKKPNDEGSNSEMSKLQRQNPSLKYNYNIYVLHLKFLSVFLLFFNKRKKSLFCNRKKKSLFCNRKKITSFSVFLAPQPNCILILGSR